MTNKQAKAEINQLYMMLSEEKKQALDVLMAQAQADEKYTACDNCIYKVNDNQTMADECYGCNENPYILIKSWGKKCANCKHHTDADEIHGYTPCGNCGIEQSNYEPKDKTQSDGEYISRQDDRGVSLKSVKHALYDVCLHEDNMALFSKLLDRVNKARDWEEYQAIPSAEPKVGHCEDCKNFRKLPLRTDTVGKCDQHWGVCPPCDWYCADFEPQESEEV